MALHNVNVPLYNASGEDTKHKLIVNEFAGRIELIVQEGIDSEITVSCYFDDLERAWNAVKKY